MRTYSLTEEQKSALETKHGCLGVGIGLLLGLGLGISLTVSTDRVLWQKDAVKHGAAEYDQNTGKWRWKQQIVEARE